MHEVILQNCAYLGGCNYPIAVGDQSTLSFGPSSLLVRLEDGAYFSVPYLELVSIDISGPGATTTGGGFMGGGFGVTGALEGMAVAAVLNALTIKSKIHTFVSLITNIGEIHLHYSGMEPSALRIGLSPVYVALRRFNAAWNQERSSVLRFAQTQGFISETEVEQLTRRLNDNTKESSILSLTKPRLPAPEIVGPKGRCSNCRTTVALHAEECFNCRAMFGPGSAWQVVPI